MSPTYEKFLRDAVQSNGVGVSFQRQSGPFSEADLALVERELRVELPRSYKAFVSTLGAGLWCSETVKTPSELYAFDEDCGEMEGFVALVENVRGVGDYLAFDPSTPSDSAEPALLYCGHDPFGCWKAAESFEAWTRDALSSKASGQSLYAGVAGVDSPPLKAKGGSSSERPWWRFWS